MRRFLAKIGQDKNLTAEDLKDFQNENRLPNLLTKSNKLKNQ